MCAEILSATDADPWDVAEIFEKLREWLRRDVDHAQRLLSAAKLQAPVVTAMRRHGHNMEVARLGCGAVAGCCQKSNQNASIMVKAGVVKEILHLMERHSTDGIVQDNACVALWRISERHGGGAEEVVRAGGLEQLFSTMEEHLSNPFVQVNACMAFERLYMKGGASPEGMQAAANRAMEAHPSNTQIKRGAKRLLEVLAQPLLEANRPNPAPSRQVGHSRSWTTSADKANQETKLDDWLMELDGVGFMMEYHCGLKQNFNSLAQVVEAYASRGEFSPDFFDDLQVKKLGHRRLFQKWCRENLSQHKEVSRWKSWECSWSR